MRRGKAKLLTALGAVGLSVIAVSGGLAWANGASNGGEVHFYEADTALSGNFGTVVLTGAVTDHGIDHQGVAGGGVINKLVLSKGSFEINVGEGGALDSRQPEDVLVGRLGNRAGPDRRRHRDGRLQRDQRDVGRHGLNRVDRASASQLGLQYERDPVSGRADSKRNGNRLLQVAGSLRPGGARRAVADLQPAATTHADTPALVVANRPTDAKARQRSIKVVRHFPRPAPRGVHGAGRRSGMRSISPIKLEGANVSDGPAEGRRV